MTADTRTGRSATLIGGDGLGLDGGGDRTPHLSVDLGTPSGGLSVSGAQPGMALQLSGGFSAALVADLEITVDVGGITFPATKSGGGLSRTWTALVRFYRAGSVPVTAIAKGTTADGDPISAESDTLTFTITLASATPDVSIEVPTANTPIPVSEAGDLIALRVRTSDQFGPRAVTWECEGRGGPAVQDASQPALWNGQVQLTALPLGNRTIVARCRDVGGNENTASVVVSARDVTPPKLEISQPTPFQTFIGSSTGITIAVRGRTVDGQSGMPGGRVEWSLTGGPPFTAATTTDNWANWQAAVVVKDYGTFTIDVRAVDAVGNVATTRIPIQTVSSYRPKDLGERLDERNYLAALLAFARDQVLGSGGGPLSSADVESVFDQPFGKLSQPLADTGDVGARSVNQLQVAAEAFRQYGLTAPRLFAGYWTFDPGTVTGTQVADQSGSGNAATLVGGATLEPGVAGGQAVRFNSTTRYLQIPHSASLAVGRDGGDFSVCFYLQLKQGNTGAWRVVAHKGNNDQERTFGIWLHAENNKLHARVSTTTSSNEGLDSASEVPLNRWVHVAYVKSGGELRLYLDGKLDQTTLLQGTVVSNTGPILVGKDAVFAGFDGLVDDLRIYGLALTDTSVAAVAAAASTPTPATLLARGQGSFRWAAYEAFLAGIGTSFEELRLVKGADAAVRDSLALRLGIRLSASQPDELSQLTQDAAQLTDATLEQIFGLRDTDPARGPLRPVARPLLLQWRERALAQEWAEADHGADAATREFPALVDPDLVTSADLVPNAVNSQAQTLLAARRQEVQGLRDQLRTARERTSTPTAGLAAMLTLALPGVDVIALQTRAAGGENIAAALDAAFLTRDAFAYLLRMLRVAATGTVTDAEWQDTYDLLTQVQKARRYAQWRVQESAIVLGPDQFQVSGIPVQLSRWRARPQARNAWTALLQARLDELTALRDSYDQLVSSVEETGLPRLRDALLAGWSGAEAVDDAGEWLTARLQIDLKAGGSLRTTPIAQAADSLQSVLFALRTGQLPQGHPARAWSLASEATFDDAWRWLGTYEGWQAAMLVFLYPENVLLPALRPDQTQAFAALVRELRQRQRINPENARALASTFFSAQIAQLHAGRLPTPAAYWPLDDAGTTVAGNPAPAPGPVGASIAFDGVDDRIVVAAPPALNATTNTFAISFWARPQAPHEVDAESTTGTAGITGQRYAYGPVQGQVTWGAGHAGVGVSVGTNGISVYEHSAGYLPSVLTYQAPIAGWVHVVVMYEDRKPRLFVDGKLVRARDTQSPQTTLHPVPDGLGGMEYGYYQGQLDDVRVYAGALTADQISLLAFRLTDERTDTQLDDLRTVNVRLLQPLTSPTPPYVRVGSSWLTELLAFVPLALAMQLQASGEYVAALDWFQTVYAYNLPPSRREIYYGLAVEKPAATDLAPKGNWTRQLNPHAVATARPNPYTRFVLMTLARCCVDFADAEFARDTSESLARARSLYSTAADVLRSPDLQPVVDTAAAELPLPNPAVLAMRAHTAMQLAKLRQGRNIAGIQRVLEVTAPAGLSALPATPVAAGAGASPQPPRPQPRPTQYRYRVLIDRTKQLVALAEQVEVAYLSALEKYDAAAYRRFEANKGIELAEAGVVLQGLRVTEAGAGVTLAEAQQTRAVTAADEYQNLIDAGLNQFEDRMLDGYRQITMWKDIVGGIDAAISIAHAAAQASDILGEIFSGGVKGIAAGAEIIGYAARAGATAALANLEALLESNTLLASHARMVEGWQLQKSLSLQDQLVAAAQVMVARDQQAIVTQERKIAETQAAQAKATIEFLDRQFTNQELYEWMSGVLAGIYRYFLQQATALARMAQDQLAFERAETPAALIRADYWEPPAEPSAASANGSGPSSQPDRRGLTGSARLLQDVYQLDQYAFETDKRKLNLSQTFSLAERAPLQFQLFRESGILPFATPMDWFDEDFPGHYLRLIRRVVVSVVALIPPGRGIRATLASSGVSRVVVGGDSFREVVVRRDPELVALTSPIAASGVFELDNQSEMLLPFETAGVATQWQFRLPPAANPFDYRSIGDVLVTLEYTALASDDYRQQVVERLNRAGRRTGDRSFSVRRDFPDQWYELLNPASPEADRAIELQVDVADFPSGLDDVTVDDVIVYFVAGDGATVDNPSAIAQHAGKGGTATAVGGVISTRRGNAAAWTAIRNTSPAGAWDLTFPAPVGPLFDDGRVADVLLVVGYGGRGPQWPT